MQGDLPRADNWEQEAGGPTKEAIFWSGHLTGGEQSVTAKSSILFLMDHFVFVRRRGPSQLTLVSRSPLVTYIPRYNAPIY